MFLVLTTSCNRKFLDINKKAISETGWPFLVVEINEYIICFYNFGSVLVYGCISNFLCLVKTFKCIAVYYRVNLYMLSSFKS